MCWEIEDLLVGGSVLALLELFGQSARFEVNQKRQISKSLGAIWISPKLTANFLGQRREKSTKKGDLLPTLARYSNRVDQIHEGPE